MKDKYKYMTPIQNKIVKALWRDNMWTRGKLCQELERAWTTLYDNLERLKKKGITEKELFNNEKRGRPVVLWSLTEEFTYDMETDLENKFDTETEIESEFDIKSGINE